MVSWKAKSTSFRTSADGVRQGRRLPNALLIGGRGTYACHLAFLVEIWDFLRSGKAFTVDYIKRQKICHFNNIRNDASGGVCVLVGTTLIVLTRIPLLILSTCSKLCLWCIGKTPEQQKAYKFTSMSAFITKNEHIFVNPCLNPRSHFQWLKLRIPDNPSERGPEGTKPENDDESSDSSDDENEDPSKPTSLQSQTTHRWSNLPTDQSKIPLEERIKNAIQNSFQKHKTTLSLKNIGMGPTLPLHICRLNYVVCPSIHQETVFLRSKVKPH